MRQKEIKIISVGGYGYTGGTALLDLLREIENAKIFETEFRLLKDPYGLYELDDALTTSWNELNVDIAIKDFLWLAQNLDRKNSKLSKSGKSYSVYFQNQFMNITNDFIKNITDFTYDIDWHILDYKDDYVKNIIAKIYRKLFRKEYKRKSYFVKIEREKFIYEVRKYLDRLLSIYIESTQRNRNIDYLVLHNAIPPYSIEKGLEYLNNAKILIVERDPRDVYVELTNKAGARFIPSTKNKEEVINGFCKYYKSLRFNQKEVYKNENVCLVRFEDLVFSYEDISREILSFLNCKFENHINRKVFFDPQNSKKNIHKWKKFEDKETIKLIESKLSDFCYN